MTEPQVWTLIGVFAAALLGMMTIMTTMFTHTLQGALSGLEGRLGERIGRVEGRITGIEGRITGVERQVDHLRSELKADIASVRVELKADIALLERDVSALYRDRFGDSPVN